MEKLQEDITKLQDDITDIEARNKAQDTNLTTLGDSVNSLQDTQVNTTKDTANKANNKANEVGSQLNSFKDSKGENGGIAPLDEQGKVPSRHLPGYIDDVVDFYGISVGITVKNESIDKNSNDEGCKVVYDKEHGCFVLAYVPTIGESEAATYYNNWLNADVFGTASTNGRIPSSGKVFLCEEDGKSYRWSGNQLVPIGSDLALGHTSSTAYPGDEGAKLQEDMKQVEENRKNILSQNKQIVARSIVNVNQLFDLADREITFSVALDRCSTSEYSPALKIPGVVSTFLTESGWVSKQWTDTSDWFKENNWSDFGAGGGKGIGDIINVNALCGNVEYTLSTAIKAVSDFEKENGEVYVKSGIILTFKTAESDKNGAPVWLTYQFTREASDITPEDLKPWVAFGGGGSNVETSDKPEEGGKDALSTGGAYAMQAKAIGGFDEESDEKYIYYKAVNLNGGQIEDVVLKIPKNGGGGGSSEDSTLSIYFEEAAPIVAFGSEIKINVALRSVSYPDGNEVLGVIRNVSIIMQSTGLTLYSEAMNETGSASATDYKFELDFTEYFSSAASKSFFVQATDADGNTKKKAITIVAVDITVEQPMPLNYTSSTALTVGGTAKNIGQFYKFPNNTSSIRATVEMLLNGEWKKLGEATVNDSYTKSISINPSNVFGGGERITHGAYPVRIYGTENKSGVRGNTIYSAIMCIDAEDTTPIVAIRFNDTNNGTLRLYDNLTIEVAAYTSGKTETHVDVFYDDEKVTSVEAMIAETLTVNKQNKRIQHGRKPEHYRTCQERKCVHQ